MCARQRRLAANVVTQQCDFDRLHGLLELPEVHILGRCRLIEELERTSDYRSRRKSEYLLVLQKKPVKAKGFWNIHNIPDVWKEGVDTKTHPHAKPVGLQQKLIEAVSGQGDIILDPAMGGGSVWAACKNTNRCFIGGDIIEC